MSLDPERTAPARTLRCGDWRGTRDERVPEELVAGALAAHEQTLPEASEVLKQDERSRVTACSALSLPIVVKEVRKSGLRRQLADCFRGSPGMRAFRAARGLIDRGIGAALPLAALERRVLGVPRRSLLVSLDLRPDPTAAERLAAQPSRRAETLELLADLLVSLHRAGARHGDLRAQHAHVGVDASGRPRARLLDLESLVFRGAPADALRLHDWAQVLASIADELASRDQRYAAFERYAAALPFRQGTREAFAEVEQRSIRRGHLFTGTPEPATRSR